VRTRRKGGPRPKKRPKGEGSGFGHRDGLKEYATLGQVQRPLVRRVTKKTTLSYPLLRTNGIGASVKSQGRMLLVLPVSEKKPVTKIPQLVLRLKKKRNDKTEVKSLWVSIATSVLIRVGFVARGKGKVREGTRPPAASLKREDWKRTIPRDPDPHLTEPNHPI